MGEPVSKAKIFIDYSGGNYQLFRVKTSDNSDEEDLEVVKAIGVDGGAGFRKSTGGGEFTMEVYRESGTPEVNYRRLKATGEKFALTFQDEDGVREQYQSCRVASVSRKDDEQGNHMDTVKIKYLQRADLT